MALDTNDPVVARTLKHISLDRTKLSESPQIIFDVLDDLRNQIAVGVKIAEINSIAINAKLDAIKDSIIYLAGKLDSGVLGTDNVSSVQKILK